MERLKFSFSCLSLVFFNPNFIKGGSVHGKTDVVQAGDSGSGRHLFYIGNRRSLKLFCGKCDAQSSNFFVVFPGQRVSLVSRNMTILFCV